MTMQACFLFKQTTDQEPEAPTTPEDTTEVRTDTLPWMDTIAVPQIREDLLKPYYKVAVLLPFYLDNRYLLDLDPEQREYKHRSMITTEYLQGVLIALEHLKADSVKLEVTFHDTRNDSNSVRGLMREPHMKEQDLIIGPLFPDKLAMMSDFVREHEIMMISPLTTRLMITDTNSYYINATPSVESHAREIARYASMHFREQRMLVFHTADSTEKALAKTVSNTLVQSMPFTTEAHPVNMIELGRDGKFDSTMLASNDTNVVIIPSRDEIFVTNVLRELNNQTVGQAFNLNPGRNNKLVDYRVLPNQIFLFGFSDWISDFNSLRFDYLNSINFYATKSFHYDTTDTAYRHFAGDFLDTFDYAPSQVAMKGYDLMTYMGRMLRDYGLAARRYFTFYHEVPINKYIDFQPVHITGKDPYDEVLHHYENRFVHMMRYADYELEPAPTFFKK